MAEFHLDKTKSTCKLLTRIVKTIISAKLLLGTNPDLGVISFSAMNHHESYAKLGQKLDFTNSLVSRTKANKRVDQTEEM